MVERSRPLIPSLDREVWLILGGDALSGIGTGLTLPFLLIYLHQVRGIDLAVAGFVVATIAVASLVGSPLSGYLADRITPRLTLIGGLLVAAAGTALLATVHESARAFVVAGIVGLGISAVAPALDALLASNVADDRRSVVFAARHTTFNAGIGIGALIAGAVIRPTSASSFVLLYRLDALSFLAFVPILLLLPNAGRATPSGRERAVPEAGGYRAVLRDRAFRHVLYLSIALMAVGFGQVGSGFVGYATRPGGVGPRVVAFALAANTVTVVVAQLFMLRHLNGRARTAGLRLVCVGFSVAWVLTLMGGRLGSGVAAAATFVAAMVVFGVAETAIPPTLPAIVNDLASDRVRGRYNGLSSMSWTIGFVLAPAIAGPLLGAGYGTALFVGLVVVLILIAFATRALERELPPMANVIRA